MQILIFFSFFDLPCCANSSGFYAVLPGLLRSSTIPSQTNQMIWLKPKTPVRSVNPGKMEMMLTAPTNKPSIIDFWHHDSCSATR
jgi:hypothetical protein